MAITTQNDAFYKSVLKLKIEEFFEEQLENDDHEFGYMPDNIATLMTEVAYNVLLGVKDTNDYRDREKV